MNVSISFDPGRIIDDAEIEELSRLNPTLCFERTAEGALVVSPPTGGNTGIRSIELAHQLISWNQKTGHGYAFDSSTGFSLPSKALLSPDAAWIARERWERLTPQQREGFPPICPDAVFELRSPRDTAERLRRKIARYIADGARLAVLIDPYEKICEAHFPGETPQRFEHVATARFVAASGDETLIGFTLYLKPFFQA